MKFENFNEEKEQEEGINIKKISYLLIHHWYWFLLFGGFGFSCAFLYNRLITPQYSVSTSILVPEKANGLDMKKIFEGVLNQPSNNNYNQIEILKSYYIINRTLRILNWRTSWFKKDMMIWRSIYKDEPFEVQETKGFVNPKGIFICIKPISSDLFSISINGELWHNKAITKVIFEGNGTFGRPFVNDHFNFTLNKKATASEIPDEQYKFVFNDLNDATVAYQQKLGAELKAKKGEIIQCTIKAEEPEKQSEFLNELIRVYIDDKMNLQNEVNRRSLDFINIQLNGISDSLSIAGTKFTDFRSKNQVIDLSSETTMVMNNLQQIETERAESQVQLDYFQNLRNYLSNANDLKKLVSPSVVGIQDASLNAMVLKLGELYNRRQYLSFSINENNPVLINLDKELTQTRSLISENLQNLIDNATKSISSLNNRVAIISSQLNKLPKKEQQMISIQRQFDMNSEVYTFLLQKRAELNISLASSIPDVQIIDRALPENAIPLGFPSRMILVVGFILGIAISLGFILLINMLDDRIRTQEDVEDNTSIPILGNIIHDFDKAALTVHENPKSIIAESFRALRTNLQFMLTEPNGKIISIQSTNPNEGKSFIAINLAAILAMNNKRVLVIGADLRKPKLHKVFELNNDHGLSTCLIGHDTIDEVIFSTPVVNLFLLPSGPIPPNPSEMLGRPEMKKLIENVRTAFDYVILDNAPTGLVTDGVIVSQLSDLNIFVLRYGVSRKQQIGMINHYAVKNMISHMAIVVNDIKSNAFGYAYSKYQGYESYHKNYYAADEGKSSKKSSRKKAEAKV